MSELPSPGQRIGLYPGTFDPITNGHMDVITRATRVVDHLIVAVAGNAGKGPMFSMEERVAMVEAEIKVLQANTPCRLEVRAFNTLLMRFTKEVGAHVIVRGLRAVSDFEYEFQMAGMNARLDPEIETVFLMASEKCQFISSRFVKEIARLDGNITSFVSPRVQAKLAEKLELLGDQ